MSLRDRLIAEISATGPISVADYMLRCLHDPRNGYYATRPALGAGGDFITAPLISQMFGELIGLWCAEVWSRLGEPAQFRLVEAGPGDGTLMSDLLRAARLAPGFIAGADLWLVETSRPLRALQAEKLAGAPLTPRWADDLDQVPGGAPLILASNELLDCLPARQFVRTGQGWAERLVALDDDGALAFRLGPPAPAPTAAEIPLGVVFETSPVQQAFGSSLGERIARDGGAALLIDYGRDAPGPGDTLQALKDHQKVDPLACPGEADLTVHADFPAALAAARQAGASTAPILGQGKFLARLGIEQRAAALAAARPDRAEVIDRQLARLVEPDQMGTLFKAACVHSQNLVPPGFEEA
ncbi:SAM-dependent methyltransferase [Caulobacter segnis]|uniref:class I SAM-dependent methyltransferase n=1 Tax=Caulobacter segnis TaxID=88688 RepID=UPI00240FCC4E|nr:SAM-dependent methyltransferase [Caulobacter segnis]MDG2523625.1 SAM-dependent methyltransferase [Caulobacter segnis]